MHTFKKQWQYHIMLLPGVVFLLVFAYFPLYGLVIAFQDFNPALAFNSPWVGLDNFKYVFSQPNFIRTIWNTLYMSVFKLIGGVVVPVIFAILLNELTNKKTKRIFQTTIYLPHFLSWVILAGIMHELLSIDGLINNIVQLFGGEQIQFLSNPNLFPWTMIISDIWKGFGFGTVIYLAALTGIDQTLYEAAAVDGATRWNKIRHITLPLMVPTIILMTVLAMGTVLNNGFDQIYNLYSPAVYSTGDIIDTYVYRLGIQQAQYSVGAAVGMFKSVVSSILVGGSYFVAYKLVGYKIF
ncbi:MAG: ABC transporter permease subunit [Vallitalea sp.]|jgi:putative aldouronate transport system permease protein|nr:ABC transporter permease subunit [Vallitalea sp.]